MLSLLEGYVLPETMQHMWHLTEPSFAVYLDACVAVLGAIDTVAGNDSSVQVDRKADNAERYQQPGRSVPSWVSIDGVF